MSKKASKNGFYYFMLDYRDGEQKVGRNFGSLSAVAEAAGPAWKALSKDERDSYDRRAKCDKGTVKKYTSQGVDVETVKRQASDKAKRDSDMKEDIAKTLNIAAVEGTLADLDFHVLHVNDFFHCHTTGRNYLAEIAVCRFNLRRGVQPCDVYHAIVNPGQLPLGYAFAARKMSTDTHLVPVPDDSDIEPNGVEVLAQVFGFLSDSSGGGKFPPVYVYDDNHEKADNIVRHHLYEHGYDEDSIKLYSLTYLLFRLRNLSAGQQLFPYTSLATMVFEKDVYDYCTGIACHFHESNDRTPHCSRSRVVRAVFTICDNCCPDLGIKFILGQHIPLKSAVATDLCVSTSPMLLDEASGYDSNFTGSSVSDYKDYAALGGGDFDVDVWQVAKGRHKGRQGGGRAQHVDLSSPEPSTSSGSVDCNFGRLTLDDDCSSGGTSSTRGRSAGGRRRGRGFHPTE